MPELYGLKNCDRCRAARRWLEGHGLGVKFVDLREHPPGARDLERWMEQLGWPTLLNKMSKTWRSLDEGQKLDLDQNSASTLLLTYPLLIKRPLLVRNHQVHVGFTPERYSEIFGLGPG